jgi:hypothetical protein
MRFHHLLLTALFLLPALRAERDRPADHPRPETARVVLYSGENFDGVSVDLLPGAEIADLGDLCFADGRRVRDRISSVRIFGDLKVTLYVATGFGGEELELTASVARLNRVPRKDRGHGNWDNCVSSVRVSGGHRDRDEPRDRDLGRDRPHRHDGPDGAEIERLVTRAYRELLAREPNGAELRRYREAASSEGWGRDQIYDDIRSSREYRSKEAGRIVDRVYRELLGREPDQSGRDRYCRNILEKGWSEDRVREDIHRSDEYRRRQHKP